MRICCDYPVQEGAVIWPDFCSALIVGRLAPLGLHNTRFWSVPVSCSPRTGADASSPRHETHRNVADSRSLKSWKGLRRQTSSVLYAPSALSAMALSYESPTVPVEGSMPNSPTLVVYTRLMYCAPWSELNRHRFNSDRGCHYRWPEWIRICTEHGLTRSMSAKGCSPDNAAAEGFFGRLKQEFFHKRSFRGVTIDEFTAMLDEYMVWYRDKRIKTEYGMSIMDKRIQLGLVA